MGFVWIWLFDATRWITGGICHGHAGGIINGRRIPVDGAQRIGILYRGACCDAVGPARSEIGNISIPFAGHYISV